MWKFTFICLFVFASCKAQNQPKLSNNYFEKINTSYIRIYSYEKNEKNINVLYYEFNQNENKSGISCLFFIPKYYPENWFSSFKECSSLSNSTSISRCASKKIEWKNNDQVSEYFDIYLIHVTSENLKESFDEEVEGGISKSYYPFEKSNIYIYKYKNNKWDFYDTKENVKGDSPRIFGVRYIESLALQKIN